MSDDLVQDASNPVREAAVLANRYARAMGSKAIGVEHWLMGLLSVPDSNAVRIIDQWGMDKRGMYREIFVNGHRESKRCRTRLPQTELSRRPVRQAWERAGHKPFGTELLLLSISEQSETVPAKVLKQHGIDAAAIEKILAQHAFPDETPRDHSSSPV